MDDISKMDQSRRFSNLAAVVLRMCGATNLSTVRCSKVSSLKDQRGLTQLAGTSTIPVSCPFTNGFIHSSAFLE